MSTDPRQVLTTANDAISRADHEGFLAHCTDDVVWYLVGDRTIRGKAELKAYLDTTYVRPPEFDIQLLVSDADHVVATGRITITGGDGGRTTSEYCDVWTLRDGGLAELRVYAIEVG